MNKSMIKQKLQVCSTTLRLIVVTLTVLLSACDGGIFGTSDGSNDANSGLAADPAIVGVEAEIAEGTGIIDDQGDGTVPDPSETGPVSDPVVVEIAEPVEMEPGEMEPVEMEPVEMEPVDPAPEDPAPGETAPGEMVATPSTEFKDPQALQTQGFSNTTPSGIDSSSLLLPALKLINLRGVPVSAESNVNSDRVSMVDVPPGQTSDFLEVNIGETLVDIATGNVDRLSVLINPLNSAQDSLTTIIVSPVDTGGIFNFTIGNNINNIRAVDTRAAVSAAAMAEVRLIFTVSADEIPDTQFMLTPDDDISGDELVFTSPQDNTTPVVGYQLATPGTYQLSDTNGFLPPQSVQLQADSVYSIVITSDVESPAYIEVDSDLP